MNPLQNTKTLVVIGPTSDGGQVDDSAFTTTEVDSLGFDYAQFYVYIGTTDIAISVMNVGHGSTVAGASTGAIIANTNFASTAGITAIDGSTLVLPNSTDATTLFRIDVDLKDKNRYLDLNLTAGNGSSGTVAMAWCILSRGAQPPVTEAGMGCKQVARE